MKHYLILICTIGLLVYNCKTKTNETNAAKDIEIPKTEEALGDIKITPISHATFILEYNNTIIYADPVGGAEAFKGQKKPTLILVTDIHADHLDVKTLLDVSTKTSLLITPLAVSEQLPESLKANLSVLYNGQSKQFSNSTFNVTVEGIAMYNLREEALKFHPKDRGNGYVITLAGKRIYISGDTEDVPEIRTLKDIDLAFVCMNLPYTMPVERAADAVLDFNPKRVYPYHYRGTEGLSDVTLFKTLVNSGNSDIAVVQLDWYPN